MKHRAHGALGKADHSFHRPEFPKSLELNRGQFLTPDQPPGATDPAVVGVLTTS
jgi:hypothetical protein